LLRLILFLILASVLAAFAVWLADQPGTVNISWRGYEVSTSFAIMLAVVAAIAAAVTLLFEILRWIRGLPRRIGRSRAHRRVVRGYEAIDRGLVAVASGDREAARFHTRQAERLLPNRPGALLLSAQTAQLEGRDDEAHKVFRAMLGDRSSELLGVRGLLAQAMKSGDRAEALDLAKRAHRLSPRTPWVLQTEFELLTRAERWEEALAVLDGIGREKLLDEPVVRRRRAILLHMLAQEHRRHERPADAFAAVRRAVKAAPGFAPAALLAAELAAEQGRPRSGKRPLQLAWGVEPMPAIAQAWIQLTAGNNPAKRYDRFRPLERMQPDHLETHLALAELAVASNRPEVARRHLERAEQIRPTQRVLRAMAELERLSGSPERADELLTRAADARPDRAWVVDETGDVVPSWMPFGPNGVFDSIHWAEPARVSRLTLEHHSLTAFEGVAVPAAASEPGRPAARPSTTDMSPAPATAD
jgi:HemY protein